MALRRRGSRVGAQVIEGGEFGMGLLRGLAGVLLWVVSLLVILVGVILCVTVILLPLGIPLIGYARRMFTMSVKLMLPRAAAHPIKTTQKTMDKRGRKARKRAGRHAEATKHELKDLGRGRRRSKRRRKNLPRLK